MLTYRLAIYGVFSISAFKEKPHGNAQDGNLHTEPVSRPASNGYGVLQVNQERRSESSRTYP